MQHEHSSYRVPTGRPFLMRELRNKLPGVDDRMVYLDVPADPTEYEDLVCFTEAGVLARRSVPPS